MPSPADLRRRLAGVAPVGGGLLLLGASAYIVLGLAGHMLASADYASVASLYLLSAITGPGIFVALEQTVNREVSSRLAVGAGTGPVLRAAALVGAGHAAAVVVLLLVVAPVLVPRALGGSWTLLAAAATAVAGAAAVYLLRGLFAGERRYGWYAASLAGEGLARIVPCAALALVGVTAAVPFGFAFALGTGVAAVLCLPGLRRAPSGPPVDLRGLARSTALLAFASGLTYLVANTAPLVLAARLPEQPDVAASFVSLFVLARIPVFLFAPLQAFLLPGLTTSAERSDAARFRAHLRLALVAVLGVGLVGAALVALFGPWVTRTFFAAPITPPAAVAGLLGMSTAAMMAAQVLQPALVALGEQRRATVAWLAGTAVFVVLLLVPGAPVDVSVAAQLGAPVVVCAVMSVAAATALRRLAVRPRTETATA